MSCIYLLSNLSLLIVQQIPPYLFLKCRIWSFQMLGRMVLMVSLAITCHGYGSRLPERPGDIVPIPGAILQLMGELLPITEFVHVIYDVEPLSLLVNEIESQYNSSSKLLKSLPTNSPVRPVLVRLNNKIANYLKDLKPQSTRQRRGLFNFVGMLAHGLFGVVDDKTMNDKLQEFQGRQSAVTHTINAQSEQIHILQSNVRQLANAAEAFYQKVDTNYNHIESLQIMFKSIEYLTAFDEISHSAERVQDAIIAAIKGEVTMSLLSPNDITNIYKNLTTAGAIPLFPPNQFNLLYACMTAYITRDGLSILIPIRPNTTYTAFSVHPFPKQINESFITLNAPDTILIPRTSQLLPMVTELAIPPQPLVTTCDVPTPGLFVCLKPLWPYTSNDSSCAYAITHQKKDIYSSCTFTEVDYKDTPYILPLKENTVFYFFEPMNVELHCNKTWTQSLNGPYVLPHTCSMSNKHMHFPSIKHYHIKYAKHMQFIHPAPLPITTHSNPPLDQLKLQTMSKPPTLPAYTGHIGFVFGYPVAVTVFGVFLLITLGIAFVCYVKQTTNKSEQASRARRRERNQEIPMLPILNQ